MRPIAKTRAFAWAGLAACAASFGCPGDDDGAPEELDPIEEPAEGAGGEAEAEAPAGELPDKAVTHASLYQSGVEPAGEVQAGEVVLEEGEMGLRDAPFLIHNGLDHPVLRIAGEPRFIVDGEELATGVFQHLTPNVIESGETGFLVVDSRGQSLPEGAELELGELSYEGELEGYETTAGLDIEAIELEERGAAGEIANPHDVEVRGPLNVVAACLDEDGLPLWIGNGHTEHESLEAGASTAFDVSFGDVETDACEGLLADASGAVDPGE